MSHQRRTPTPLSTHEQDMKIYDLTRGKYPKLYAPTAMGAELRSFGAVRRKHHERRVYCVVMNSKL